MNNWGCFTYVKGVMLDKLAKSNKYIFVRYARVSLGCYFYNPLEQMVFVSKHVIYFKKKFIVKRESESKIKVQEVQEPQTNTSTNLSLHHILMRHSWKLVM